jgi:2-polyprenyl-6-methoxyphenol hydroxylase-like FAD-dependent oxidoreductase
MSERHHILIAGAGIGGLAAGLSLLRKGFDVTICDQAPDLREVGAGVQTAANASRVLIALGLGDELARIGYQPTERETRLWNTGQRWTQIALGATALERYGFPHYTVHRADLQHLLIEAVRREKPDAIRLGARCIGFEQTALGVALKLESGETILGDALVGADGIHSTIRGILFGEEKPRFTGFVAWRGLAPAAKLPAALKRQVSTNWISPNAHAVHYLVRNGELMNIIAVVERDDWQVESWTAQGTTAEWAADYAGWHPDIHAIIANVEVPFKWALMLHEPLPQWSVGRVTLLGDACHAALPFLAQGAAMAIEDGYVLARCAEQHRGDIAATLRQYERARMERTARMARGAAEQTSRLHNPALADPETAQAHVKRVYEEQLVTKRLDWLYSYDAVNGKID